MLRFGLIVTFVVSCLANVSYGQVQKGNLLMGGDGQFSAGKSKDETFVNGALSPNIGYFISDHFGLGIGIPYAFGKYTGMINHSIGISPFARFYFLTKEKSSFYIPLNIHFSTLVYNSQYTTTNTIYSYSAASLGIGYVYFISSSVGLEPSLVYHFQRTSNNIMANSLSTFNGVNFRVGFQFYLNRNK